MLPEDIQQGLFLQFMLASCYKYHDRGTANQRLSCFRRPMFHRPSKNYDGDSKESLEDYYRKGLQQVVNSINDKMSDYNFFLQRHQNIKVVEVCIRKGNIRKSFKLTEKLYASGPYKYTYMVFFMVHGNIHCNVYKYIDSTTKSHY